MGVIHARFQHSIRKACFGFWMKIDTNYEHHPVLTKIAWIHTRNGNTRKQTTCLWAWPVPGRAWHDYPSTGSGLMGNPIIAIWGSSGAGIEIPANLLA